MIEITEGFNRREVTAVVFLDVAKAFDRVWHDGLCVKMMDLGYPTAMVELVKSYLTDRQLRCKVEGALSGYRGMEAGVPQGTVLSPHLFNIFRSDIPNTSPPPPANRQDRNTRTGPSRSGSTPHGRLGQARMRREKTIRRRPESRKRA